MAQLDISVIAALIANEQGIVFEALPAEFRGVWCAKARATVQAMREPSDAMLKAANAVGIDMDPMDYWPAMIDELLKSA